MSVIKAEQSLLNLNKALSRLEEAVERQGPDRLIIDGTIQRFEFTIEIYWKVFKRFLELEGIETKTPREALKGAFKAAWLENDDVWLKMLQDRNQTSHMYDEAQADEIYENIKRYVPEMRLTFAVLQQRLDNLQ